MRFLNIFLALCLIAGVLSSPSSAAPESTAAAILIKEASADELQANKQLSQLAHYAGHMAKATLRRKSPSHTACNLSNLSIRQEWSALSGEQRKAYTDAVLCLQRKPAKTPSSLVPGAKNRLDDFVALHMNRTNYVHYSGTFLGWHRYYIWAYERALRDECGYDGVHPYWDWALTARIGLENSTMLDGSEYSMSGNGEYIPNKPDIILDFAPGNPPIVFPAGTGGGCVTSGPFKDMKINLGPAALSVYGNKTEANGDGYAYNPRCLKRDLSDWVNRRLANATRIVQNIVKPTDIYDFQMMMQGYPGTGDLGIHGGGHYSIGGDPGRDIKVSPGDPLFYLHHAMIDRVWWIWQLLDREERTGEKGIAGTNTFMNIPPSENTTLDTVVDLGYAAGPPLTMRDVMSTTDGPFCYIYR